MNTNLLFEFTVNKEKKAVHVKREFAAGPALVWEAFTKPELLDQWWAPKPYQTRTKRMDFRQGGSWLYCMVAPTGDKHWCRADYQSIDTGKQYTALDAFCDEEGVINSAFPRSLWNNVFKGSGESTIVDITITYQSLADLEKIIALGFREGFTMAMGNLDQYIQAQGKLRKEMGVGHARTASYLNFPGNTEEVFRFYQSVFGTEFIGRGLVRFSELPPDPSMPPLAEHVRKMVLHVELPITGGHVLMATDAPPEMGFKLVQGNNMHINLEPDTRDEAKRLFEELSAGGTVTMALQDMPWGSYFGSFTDRYGINWMVNHNHTH
ncbi:MAG: SRPBCC domain-containing protein [Cyclobacteriaceae bacterium]|nr:SRPBCC domain-containing protein [Cyclobacteriaceae bacterium]